MHIYDLISEEDLQRALDEKLVNVRFASDGQRIYNYSDLAMFTPGAWDNPAVRACRGLVVAADGFTVVGRPWSKFFNHNQVEAGTVDMHSPVEVTDKMDGSLGIIHQDESGQWRVASRGSFESDQAIHATEVLQERYVSRLRNVGITPLVEIIYPENRIVCNYEDTDDLILLGGVEILSGEYFSPSETAYLVGWNGPVTRTFNYGTLAEALAADPREGAEGLCVRFIGEPKIVKIKQEDYVALHKIVTGLSERSVWEHMCSGAELEDLLVSLPDELHSWTVDVWEGLVEQVEVIKMEAQAKHITIIGSLGEDWTRKDYAQEAIKSPELRAYLFALLDGKDITSIALKNIKPAGDTRAKTFTEATA